MARKDKEISIEPIEARDMTSSESLVVAQLLAGWIIKDIECRRQIAKIALTTKADSVTIVQNDEGNKRTIIR